VLNTPPLIRHVEGSNSLDIATMLRNSTHIRDIVDCYQLQFCGHSLGGALAVLAALDISVNIKKIVRAAIRVSLPEDYREDATSAQGKFMQDRVLQASKLPRVSVYTFGTPKIGNSVFAHLLDDIIGINQYFRVQVDGDAVVNGFPSIFYSHAGTEVCVDSEATGSIVVNPTIVETHLLGQGNSALRNHSLEVYRYCLEAGLDSEDLYEYRRCTYEPKKIRRSSQGGCSEGSLDWMSKNRKL
jgi:acetyl esterase/lipase